MSAMDEDDIYGEDIYGGVSELGKSDLAVPSSNGFSNQVGIKAEQASDVARLATDSSSQQDQATNLQGQLHRAQNSLQEWHNAFQSIAAKSGLPLEPTALLAHLQQTHHQPTTAVTAGSTATEDVNVLKQRESQLQAQLMEKILENMELRRHLQAAKAAAEPNVVQVRQLLLDPAVNREFKKIHKALEDKSEEAKRLLEELQGTLFQQESKQGRLLVARCRVLIDENEEMGRELSEDRVHKLERQLALAKAYAEDMQAAFQECEDHATALDEEAEKIQEENFKLRRQMQELEARRPPQFGMRGGPRDGNRPYIQHNNWPPFHNNSPPMSRPYTRRPVDSALPPNKRGMAPPDRRDEGDRFSSRPRAR